jgi:DNA modification methylase
MNIEILQGDCIESLKKIEDGSINTCITSPPYWGLRDYNGESKQLGMEDTPEEFTENLVKVFREIKRVLRDDGTAWLNLGDSYSSGGRTTTTNQSLRGDKDYGVTRPKPSKGIKPKDLIGIPWRVAFALQADGWYLRQDIIWHKPNPMPESVRDSCTKAHEYIFLLSKNVKYYYDHEAIKEDAKYPQGPNSPQSIKKGQGEFGMDTRGGLSKIGALAKRNKRSVWTITTKPFKGAHFATFPKDLIEPCVLAGCPEKVCVQCSEPYKLKVDIKRIPRWELSPNDPRYRPSKYENAHDSLNGNTRHSVTETKPLGLEKQCDCQTNETKGGTVLDPFGGSGTTGIVAASHNRNAILLELNAEYIELAKARINKEVGMMATIKHIKEINP